MNFSVLAGILRSLIPRENAFSKKSRWRRSNSQNVKIAVLAKPRNAHVKFRESIRVSEKGPIFHKSPNPHFMAKVILITPRKSDAKRVREDNLLASTQVQYTGANDNTWNR